MGNIPRVSFGIIVLNGEPFTRYCLRALYPFAHEIIVVEGATAAAASMATAAGHSTDGTLETLQRFKEQEDPDDKVQVVVRDGFWSEKDEQSQAYAERATGDYLWQVDIDEFYQADDMRKVLQMLANDPQVTAVSFRQIAFWGGFDYITDGWFLRRSANVFHRLFKWGPGYRYVKHRPPTVHDPQGRDLRRLKWVSARQMARQGILLYHYGQVFPQQVLSRFEYHRQLWAPGRPHPKNEWAKQNFLRLMNPFRVHNDYRYASWLERFRGKHPWAIEQLIADLKAGRIEIALRQNEDVEEVLRSGWYRLGRFMLKTLAPLDAWRAVAEDSFRRIGRRPLHYCRRILRRA